MPRLPIRAPASLALLAALVLAAPAPAGAAQDSKKNADAEAKFLAAFRAAGEDDTARSKAVLDLNDAPDAVKVNALLKKVLPREDAPKVISAAIGVLRGVKDPAALKVLGTEAIEKGPWPVRGAVIEALGGVRDPAGVEALRKVVKAGGGDPKPLSAAAFALAQTRSPDAMPEVLTLLGHGAWQVRLGAYEYLAVLRRLFLFLHNRAVNDRRPLHVAAILRDAQLLVPAEASNVYFDLGACATLVRDWSRPHAHEWFSLTTFLLAENLSDLHAIVRTNPLAAPLQVTLPTSAELRADIERLTPAFGGPTTIGLEWKMSQSFMPSPRSAQVPTPNSQPRT